MADVEIAGKHVNKFVLGGVVIGGAAVVYYVYKNHKASQAASSSSSSTGMVTDPGTGTQYPADGTDPATGETYAQEIGQYGSVQAADSAVSANASSYLQDQGNLFGTGYSAENYSTGTYGAGTTTSGSVYTSNSAWAEAATAGLTDIGYTGTDVAAALGLYLTGAPMTTTQAALVKAAIAEYGNPPVGTFQIITQPAGNTGPPVHTPPTPKPPVTKKPAPKPTPKPAPKPKEKAPGTPTGVRATKAGTSSVHVTWHKVAGATSYKVHSTSGENVRGAYDGHTVTTSGTSATVQVRGSSSGTVHVVAVNSAGSSPEANASYTTK